MYEVGFAVSSYLTVCAAVVLVTKRSIPHFVIYAIDSLFAFVMIFFATYCFKLQLNLMCAILVVVSLLVFIRSYKDLNRYNG